MSIVIQNMSEVEKGLCLYALRINSDTLSSFTHVRSEGLATCLRKAADAIEQYEYKNLGDIPDHVKSREERARVSRIKELIEMGILNEDSDSRHGDHTNQDG